MTEGNILNIQDHSKEMVAFDLVDKIYSEELKRGEEIITIENTFLLFIVSV